MKTVIKKNGSREDYNPDKIKSALANTSDDIGQPLNESDIHSIVAELESILRGKDSSTTRDIHVVIVGILFTRGQKALAESFTGYKLNSWK